jgi:sulfhydrogenase subunit gamma (sulfur reductase)
MRKETYAPETAEIIGTERENPSIKTFRLRLKKGKLNFMPGQFVQVSVFGVGEAPISMCSSPFEKDYFETSVRKVGNVTSAMFRLKEGDTVGIRGPYGRPYPVNKFMGKNLVLVAGGVGFPPLNSLVEYLAKERGRYKRIFLLYGARTPEDLIFRERVEKWKKRAIGVYFTVDKPDNKWKGDVGVVTTLFDKYRIEGEVGIACGPPVMLKFVTQSFQRMGIKDPNIHLSLERMMQCGTGKCGHCNIGNQYVCLDGPVFNYEQLKGLTEKVWK